MKIILSIVVACLSVAAWGQDHAEKAAEFVQRGDLKSAEEELRKALTQSPNDPVLLTSLGGILGMEGDLQHANPYLTKAVELDPRNPALRRNLAANQWQLGKLSEARANLEHLVHDDRGDKGAIFLLGMVLADQRDYARSATLLESVPEVLERQPQGWIALASSYYHTGRADEGRTALRNLLQATRNPDLLLAAGHAALDAGDVATAKSAFESVRKGQASPEVNVLLCQILAAEGSTVRALEAATQASEKYPDSYRLYYIRASLEMKLQYYSKAVESAGKAVALHPSAETMRDLAAAEWRSGMRKQAAARFEQIFAAYPRDAAARELYGTLLLDEGSPRAIELLRQAVALDGASGETLYQLGNAELQNGRAQQALPYLQRAVKQQADDSRVHYALSRAYRHLGRTAEAQSEMGIYQKLKGQTR